MRARLRQTNTFFFVPIGLNAVYGWRDRREKEIGPTGKRVPVSRPIEQLSLIEWVRRRVYLLFDTNVRTNLKVAYARNELAQELAGRGAEAFFIEMPEEEDINGIDGFLAKHGPARRLSCLSKRAYLIPTSASPGCITPISAMSKRLKSCAGTTSSITGRLSSGYTSTVASGDPILPVRQIAQGRCGRHEAPSRSQAAGGRPN